MSPSQRYEVSPIWTIAMKDLGLKPSNVLRRAQLPDDLLNTSDARISAAEYFALYEAMSIEAKDPLLALKVADVVGLKDFDPVIYAGFCSPDLNHAAGRIALFKRLLAPVVLSVDINEAQTTMTFGGRDPDVEVPSSYSAGELVWWTAFARTATRERIIPTKVVLPERQDDAFVEFFGAPITVGHQTAVTFAAEDATLPFLAANEQIWRHLEPSFQQRLADLEAGAPTKERIRAALIEMLPSGQATLADVGKRLGVGARTLQRRLTKEGTTFQEVLNQTRESLALHYLKNSRVSCTEISFLLGFEDPNSFFRAFHGWTGNTPEATRDQFHAA